MQKPKHSTEPFSKPREVVAFKTSDGTVYETKEEALKQERQIVFRNMLFNFLGSFPILKNTTSPGSVLKQISDKCKVSEFIELINVLQVKGVISELPRIPKTIIHDSIIELCADGYELSINGKGENMPETFSDFAIDFLSILDVRIPK